MTATLELNALAIDDTAADMLFRDAHTAYAFTDAAVSDEQLAAVYDLVRHAPTAMNAQPLRITYVRSDQAKARLLPHLSEGNRAKSASAPVVAILSADTDFHENLPRLLPQNPGAREMFADEEARTRTAMFNATMQAGYFVLAVRAAGLDAGPMAGIDAAAVDAEFFAGTALRTFMVVNIGRVADGGSFPRNPRLSLDEAVTTI
jgi:3-hydroxypropanoate dehydrogenase